MKKVSILLAGCGGYGKNYVRGLLDYPEPSWKFEGVVDPMAEKSIYYNELRERNIPIYENMEDFFREHRADLSIIAAPIHTHYEYSMYAMDKGSSVLCEKPVCADANRLDALEKKERETGLFMAVGYQRCFARNILALKRDILDGLFGKPLQFKMMRMPRRGTAYYTRNGWAGKQRFGGEWILDSPLQNACGHEFQLMLFLLGNSPETSADLRSLKAELWRGRPGIENYDAAAVRVDTNADAPIYFYTAHCVHSRDTGPTGEFCFEKGTIHLTVEDGVETFTARFNDGRKKHYESAVEKNNSIQKMLDSVEAVRNKSRPVCTLATVRPHLDCVLKAQEFPITAVAEKDLVRGEENGDEFFYIPGLEEAFSRSYDRAVLPSDINFSV
ncbi:oxidoreductase [Spirochaetia bacterium]|nr:oxidoreductase [Spirochaetia bacterium]